MAAPMSIAKQSLALTGLFEAELLTELLLRFWGHPLAADPEHRNTVLEGAAEALRLCLTGQQLFEGLPPRETNLVAAIWYVEWCAVNSGAEDPKNQRRDWLDKIRKALPSCF